jgi:hypothetical protein
MLPDVLPSSVILIAEPRNHPGIARPAVTLRIEV